MTDLHMHSTYSDGSLTPAELLEMAEKKGLKLISITDHSRVGAYKDLKDPCIRNKFSGKILPGSELSTFIDGQSIEILGYGVDTDQLQEFITAHYHSGRMTELDLIYDSYVARGVHFSRTKESYDVQKDISAKRFVYYQLLEPENRKFWLDPANQAGWGPYYRQELYNPKSPLYVDYSPLFPTPKQVVAAIHNAGGKAFLAHCYIYTEAVWGHLPEIAERLGVDGFECRYPAFTPEQKVYLEEFCRSNHLLMSGGSDFHGLHRPQIQLGCEPMELKDLEWVKELKTL